MVGDRVVGVGRAVAVRQGGVGVGVLFGSLARVAAAVAEGVTVIGISVLSGAHLPIAQQLFAAHSDGDIIDLDQAVAR